MIIVAFEKEVLTRRLFDSVEVISTLEKISNIYKWKEKVVFLVEC